MSNMEFGFGIGQNSGLKSNEGPTLEANYQIESLLDEIEFNIEAECFIGDGIVDGAKELLTKIVREMPRDSWSMNARFYWLALMVDFETCDDNKIAEKYDEVVCNINYKKAKIAAQKFQNAAMIERIEKLEQIREEILRKQKEEAEWIVQEKIARDFLIANGELQKYMGNDVNVVIPDGVTSIGNQAFFDCTSLTSITIPNSVTSIGERAFHCCTSLTSITIPNSVTSIGSYAFCCCDRLESITIPNSVTSIGSYAFWYCTSLTSITIPSSVTSIGESAFWDCTNLTSITIPSSVTSIGNNAFHDCTSLTSITIPSSVTRIGESAFYGCTSLTSITIPSSVTSIGNNAFHNCTSLNGVTFAEGSSLTIIGSYAFYGCTSLTSVTIPKSVTIGYDAFRYVKVIQN